MRFTPEDLLELKPFIDEVVKKETEALKKRVQILEGDIGAIRRLHYNVVGE